MSKPEIVLCAPLRTPIGTFGGALKDTPATTLGAAVVRETLRRAGLPSEAVDTVVLGQVIQAGAKMNPARQAAIGGGLPLQVPAVTVNRVCGSGAQAIASAALKVAAGYAKAAIAGGMENMDQAPYLSLGARWGSRMGDAAMLAACCETVSTMPSADSIRAGIPKTWSASTGSPAKIRTAGQRARNSVSARHRGQASSTRKSLRSNLPAARGRCASTATRLTAPTRPSKRWPSSSPLSARTAALPPATRLDSIAARLR